MYVLNIDKPTKSCTLHLSNCNSLLIKETKKKGIGQLLEDGGWIEFFSKEEAINCYESKHLSYSFRGCSKCI
jgi:hypothetical protein